MYALIELDEEILSFINHTKNYIETFEEIKDLIFTRNQSNSQFTFAKIFNITWQFKRIKSSALSKALDKKKLNFAEGFIFERLFEKYINNKVVSIEQFIKMIQEEYCTNTHENNNNQISQLYGQLIERGFS